MRKFACLILCLSTFSPERYTALSFVKRVIQSRSEQELQLSTTIRASEYCSSPSDLMLTLELRFTNVGSKPILLQKKSSVIGRFMISRSLQKAEKREYLMDATDTLDWPAAGFTLDSLPELALFTKLDPGESYSTERKLPLSVFETKDDLQPGRYLLQVKVPTWYYLPEYADEFRERWKDQGFLWTKTVTSTPMPFEVKRGQPAGRCANSTQ